MIVITNNSDNHEQSLDGIRQGEQQALAQLFSRYRAQLRRMVEFRLDARVRARVSPSDILQETYIDALKRLRHYRADPSVPFFVWLRSVTLQRLIDVHRQHLGKKIRDVGREVRFAGCDAAAGSSQRIAGLMANISSPSRAAQVRETQDRVRAAMDRLDPADREVLVLRHFEQLSNLEIASLLGIQAAAASKRYVRAIERLKDALEQVPGLVGDAA